MKKISKIFAMALIALSVFCLASCGGNSGGGKTDGDVIEINYWHGNGAALETALEKIKANFVKSIDISIKNEYVNINRTRHASQRCGPRRVI